MEYENVNNENTPECEFDSLYASHFTKLAYYAARKVGGDMNEGENIAQEAFLIFHEKAGALEFANGRAALSFIFRTAANLAMNHNRRSFFRKMVDRAIYALGGGAAKDRLENVDTRADFDAALAKVPETYHEVLVLKYITEMSVAEIAEVTGLNEGTVKSRLFNGSIKMAQFLKGYTPKPRNGECHEKE